MAVESAILGLELIIKENVNLLSLVVLAIPLKANVSSAKLLTISFIMVTVLWLDVPNMKEIGVYLVMVRLVLD